MDIGLIVMIALVLLIVIVLAKTAVVVPQQSAYVVERLGRFSGTISAGFHILIPFLDVIRYRHSLKEVAIDIPEQICITRDNVQVGIDGVLYLKVLDPERASYGIHNYIFAITQLAQTTLRSEVGKIELDRTFDRRRTCSRPWRSRCVPSARSARPFSTPRALAIRLSTLLKARSSR
jgi:regulator of protease activity HflC (stomatin/prohibitin superfamily)